MSHVYRASALGGCDKALIAARLGYLPRDPPDHFAFYFERGNQTELEVIDWLHGQDYKIRDSQLEVVIDCPMDAQIVGHLDGIVTSPQGAEFVGEIKRMSTPAFEEFLAKTWSMPGLVQKYKWQLSAYMVATGLPGLVVVREGLKDGVEGVPRTRVVEVVKPFYDRTELVRRVVELELAARKGLPETCSNPSYPCGWFYLHEQESDALFPEPDANPEQVAEVTRRVVDYRAAQAGAEQAKAALSAARQGLVAAMGERTKTPLPGGGVVSRYMKKNPWRWDEAKMREDGVEVDRYRSQTTSEQVRVTGD